MTAFDYFLQRSQEETHDHRKHSLSDPSQTHAA